MSKRKTEASEKLWLKCEDCGEMIYKKDWEANLKVCPECNYHFQLTVVERIELTLDNSSFEEMDTNLEPVDFLDFKDSKKYGERLKENQAKTNLLDAIVTGTGRLGRHQVVIGFLDFRFMGGSMGSVVGEKVTRAIEKATDEGLPLIVFSSSGGARMQEGIISLMQMAKTAAALAKLDKKGGLYLSVLTNPTTGGVTASFATLGDIIIAEPRALIGFAGPRVIEQTIGQKLPAGFQRSEFLLEHGLIDMIVPRLEMKAKLKQIIELLGEPKASDG
jgi:acetyl-CoA carboxylase carboxyl transferase subunit beta